jgi:hypothetical protein
MRLRLPVFVALLLFHLPVWGATCASLIAPVISGRSLGAQIRAMALAESKIDDDKRASLVAGRLLEVIGTEIQNSDPYFFLDDSNREAAFIYLDLIADLAPEISLDQVQKFREQLLAHNLYFSRYLHISAEEFGKLTQKGRRSLLQGAQSRRWLKSEEVDRRQLQKLRLPERLRGFEEKNRRLNSVELVSIAAIRNHEGLIGYQAWYKADLNGEPVRFDFYYTSELKPMSQEIQLLHLKDQASR